MTTHPTIDRLLDGFEENYNAQASFFQAAGDYELRVHIFVSLGQFGFALVNGDDTAMEYQQFPILATAEARELIRKELEKVL